MSDPTPRGPFTPRPTIYKGVQMRSRLEAWWAQRLDRAGVAWEYEPCAFGGDLGQYLPDFRYGEKRPGGRVKTVYVELKGVVADPGPFCDRMAIIWESEPESTLILIEGHADRAWLGFKGCDGSPIWCQHEGDALGTVA